MQPMITIAIFSFALGFVMSVYPPPVLALTVSLLLCAFAFGVRISFKKGDQIAILGSAEDEVMHNAKDGAPRCAPLEVLAGLGAYV